MQTSTCQACGRIMREKSDFPRGNFSSDYCSNCVDHKGMLKPREIIRVNMIRCRVNEKGMDQEEAVEIVDNLMPSLPAWKTTRSRIGYN